MMSKKKQEIKATNNPQIDRHMLFMHVAKIIENRKYRAATHVNQETTMMFWEVGHYINSVVLNSKRAEYGKNILTTPAAMALRCAYKTEQFGSRRKIWGSCLIHHLTILVCT